MEATCAFPSLLGLFDSPCPSLYCSPYENKIGGYPDFYSRCALSSSPSCPVCGKPLVLLVQVYCPLENSVYHRIIHIFCCTQPSCHKETKSWLVLRSQLKDEPSTVSCPPSVETGMSADDWCGDADDWGDAPDQDLSTSTAGLSDEGLDEQLEQLTLDETDAASVPTAKDSNFISTSVTYSAPFYPPCYVRVVEEPGQPSLEEDTCHARELLKKYQSENPDIYSSVECSAKKASRGKHVDGDGYEKATPRHGDRAFQKFYKTIIKCPQQLLRYSHGGDPVLITDSPQYSPPKLSQICCKECGAPSVFELQVMPTLVYVLQTQLEQCHGPSESCANRQKSLVKATDHVQSLTKADVVEFGTILVYTCSKSCWADESPPRMETLFIQVDNNQF